MNSKSNGKCRLRTFFCFSIVLGGLTIIAAAGASAQSAMTNTASALSAPASNLLVLATAEGKVRVLDSKGLLLESNMVYLPRIKISDLSDSELHSLLETKKAYAALISLGPLNERNAQSAVIENQLREVWLHGKSLAERIQTRLELIDDIRAYNADIAWLPGLMVKADNEAARANFANDWMAYKDQAATNAAGGLENTEDARAMGDASRRQVHDAWSQYETANASAARADNRAAVANYRSAVANQSVQNYLNACAALSADLAGYGINVPAAPPFYPVPPLSMKTEVDADRMASRPSAISSTTGQ